MLNCDLQVLTQLTQWLEKNQRCLLITVANTWGSSPRPVGSLLAISASGQLVGSVSGGCVEDDLLRRTKNNEFWNKANCFVEYGSNTEAAQKFSLPCGGQLLLFIEPMPQLASLKIIIDTITSRKPILRQLSLATGETSLHTELSIKDFYMDENKIMKVYGPSWRLILIGACQLSCYVTELALMLNYDVYVCDPREEHVKSWQLNTITINTDMPDDMIRNFSVDNFTAIATLTHDPKLDDLCLLEALKSEAFYVGALGSKKTNATRRARLADLGLDKNEIERLHGPIGIDIGSHTPGEIAISIMAEITATRHCVDKALS